MNTEIIDIRNGLHEAVIAAVKVLNRGEPVALPTETVYGLSGGALDPEAVSKIFEAKERPTFDPLIVHIESQEWLSRLVPSSELERPVVKALITRFWPGPLTILFSRSELVPDLVTAGLERVAIRMPSHPLFTEVLRVYEKPLAAPSANRFGRISPTRAEHVFEELGGRIPLIVDAGPTFVGLESTIVQVEEGEITILRHGAVTEESLSEIAPTREVIASKRVLVPGQMASHYAPQKCVRLFGMQTLAIQSNRNGLICWGPVRHTQKFRVVRSLSETRNLRVAAQRLFGLLREMDALDIEEIFIEAVPEIGIGRTIMNRIRRASAPRRKSF